MLEGDGFEPSVPRQIRSRFRDSQSRLHHGLTVSLPGTESSDPFPFSAELAENLTADDSAELAADAFRTHQIEAYLTLDAKQCVARQIYRVLIRIRLPTSKESAANCIAGDGRSAKV